MTAQNLPVNAKKPLWRRLVKWTIRSLIVLVVLGVAAYAIANYWAARVLHNEIARIRAKGEPLTFADLDALTPKVDRAQDAGPYYTAAAELVNSDFETNNDAYYATLYGHNAPAISPEALAWARRSLDDNRLSLELLDRGSALSACNSDIQLQYGITVALSGLGKPRNLIDVASLRSRVLAVEGNGDEAVDSVISSLGLLRTMDRQPILIAGLVQLAMLQRASGDACFILERGRLSDSAIQKLAEAMQRLHLVPPRQLFIAERVFFLEINRRVIGPNQLAPESVDQPLMPERIPPGVVGRFLAARSLPSYGRYIEAASGDWPGILTAMENVADKPASIWDQITGPSFARSLVTYGRTLSTYRSTLIALQLERFRLAHAGQLPGSLADLPRVGGLPKDPFTGNALLFVKVPDGYCVFSAGRGHPSDDARHIDRDKDPVAWSERWGIHIRLPGETPVRSETRPSQ